MNTTQLAAQLFEAGQTTALMENSIFASHKEVKRCVMNRLDYTKYRGWDLPDDEDGTDEGYLVEYLDGGKSNHPWHTGYISWSPKAQFDNGYNAIDEVTGKTYNNSTTKQASNQVPDLEFWGNGDTFKLICKASSKAEGWMKSTKAMEIAEVGVVIQVTTQQNHNVAEALTLVRGARIYEEIGLNGLVVSRKIVPSIS